MWEEFAGDHSSASLLSSSSALRAMGGRGAAVEGPCTFSDRKRGKEREGAREGDEMRGDGASSQITKRI